MFAGLQSDLAALVAGFDTAQREAIAQFIVRATRFACERTALLRAQTRSNRTAVSVLDPHPNIEESP